MSHSCRVCGAISDEKRCPQHRLTPRAKARVRGDLRAFIIARDHGVCQICGVPVARGDERIDHVISRAQGGPTTPENLRLTCPPCNGRKADL